MTEIEFLRIWFSGGKEKPKIIPFLRSYDGDAIT